MNPETWTWMAIALLGVWHGVNPGMGWLFAVALGMQEGKGSAVWRALTPLALGHALAVGAVVLVALLVGTVVPAQTVKWSVAALLVGFGLLKLVRRGHPSFGGMRVGARDLTLWSFLMASAHGAGLMVLPFMKAGGRGAMDAGVEAATTTGATTAAAPAGLGTAAGGHAHHGAPDLLSAAIGSHETMDALLAVLVHTGAYLLVTGALAGVVVSVWGLRLLRSLWIDLDRIWAAVLVLTGVATAVL